MRSLLLLTFWLIALPLPLLQAAEEDDVAATLVIFNKNDAASSSLAATYAQKRKIAQERVIGLDCPAREDISREEYDDTIANPLRKLMLERGWWKVEGPQSNPRLVSSSIRFVALMRGIPLRVRSPSKPREGDRIDNIPKQFHSNEAAIDSELATLALVTPQISGPVANPYFRCRTSLAEANLPGLLLVCRLDAPTPQIVHRMIDDSLRAEKEGLWGFAYVDSRNIREGGYLVGDQWMRNIADGVRRAGIPWVHENTPHLFADAYPMSRAALYFGWYATEVKGPFADANFRFEPGAIAVHLYSFSAPSMRQAPLNWAPVLLERGAAATLGNVLEPYLQLTPDLSFFYDRLQQGATFAEAAYGSQRVLSWKTTFIGDPLYRPYKGWSNKTPPKNKREYGVYREGVRLWLKKSRSQGEAFLTQRGRELKSGVIFEGMAAMQVQAKDPKAALASLESARLFYDKGEDQVRCTLHAVGLLLNLKEPHKALNLAKKEIATHPDLKSTALLREVADSLSK